MDQGPVLLDLVIGLLQSLVVLLLASGVYVALVVRERNGPSAEAAPAVSPGGPQRVV